LRKNGKYRTYFCKSEKEPRFVKDKSFVFLATMETLLGKVFEKNERVKSHQTRWNGTQTQ
jgi:hypothetical protein